MNLVSLSDVSFGYGSFSLLDKANLNVERGDMLALTGPNGCGKTTLLKIISGELVADSGLVERIGDLKSAYLPQEVPAGLCGDIFSIAASGLGREGELLAKFRKAERSGGGELDNLAEALAGADESHFWREESFIESVLAKLGLDPDLDASKVSAGLKRRAVLAKCLVAKPDLLMLDEPTNHLDVASVEWLEDFLKSCGKTVIFVSHDRMFLEHLATRVVEVDRARLISFNCPFGEFTRRRDEFLEAQRRNDAEFDKKLKREEAWLRRGVKARRTRNEGRVRELMRLRAVRAERRERKGVMESLSVNGAASSGEKVFTIKNLTLSFCGRKLIDDFSTTIYRGDKIGIVGANGIGKTTLVNLILGKLKPDSGSVEFGTKIKLGYFDQLRARLDPQMRPVDFIGDNGDYVVTRSGAQNVMGYLQNFMFTPEQILGKISMLSGGERNRLMLAKLLATPANVLVLDEPTNDLDMDTLELLENSLIEFDGTILLVSHDRAFLNNVTTAVFGFEGGGKIAEVAGGYDEWHRHLENLQKPSGQISESRQKTAAAEVPAPKKREKLSNRERAELEDIPKRIEAVEREQSEISAKMQDAQFIRQNPSELESLSSRFDALTALSDSLLERLIELEERANALKK